MFQLLSATGFVLLISCALAGSGCKSEAAKTAAEASSAAPVKSPSAIPSIPARESAPPPSQTGGFDGQRAFDHTAKLVAIGSRQPDSDGIHQAQKYIRGQLDSFGCAVEEDDFHSQTPIGTVSMKNIIAKISGDGSGIILLLTHYDTKKQENFVGAVDGGSSTGLMLEMARILCGRKQPHAVWIAFLDGEEAFVQWTNTDSVYGSRELAAKLAVSGELQKVKAVILADMVGPINLKIQRDTNSTKWLTDLVWSAAARLGYQEQFVSTETAVEDDHLPFIRRKVPSVDIIDLNDFPYWHTPQDTMDKVSPRSLAIVGHVILETVNQLQKKP